MILRPAFICVALFFALHCDGQTLYFVSPNGNGDDFTIENPGSLQAVQSKLQSGTSDMEENIIISLLEGRYWLDAPIIMGPDDSGNNGFQVILKAHKGGVVSISGGTEIKGWQVVGGGVYKASYIGPGFRQLYVNGERAVRARTPNLENDKTYGPYYRTIDWSADDQSISIQKDEIGNWKGFQDVEMVIKKHWNQNRMRLNKYETKGKVAHIYFREPEVNIDLWTKGCCPGFEEKQTYYFENSIDFLDAPGEWFLDRERNEIYYIPRSGEEISELEVIAPNLESILQIDGASNISFEGLIFEHANWDMPDSARIGVQAGWRREYPRTFIPGGIQVVRSHHLKFSGNIIRHFGGAGIEYLHSTHDNVIEGNLITDISGNGIQININVQDTIPSLDKECINEVIRNNYVIKTACEYTGNTGIMATYVSNMLIEHNEVADMPYTGISIGWGWSDKINSIHDNVIRGNKIHHTGQLHDDGAGIYSLSKSEGTIISENYLYEIRKSEWAGSYTYGGIYLDNGSALNLVENNVVQNVDVHPLVAWNAPNHSNTFQNNFYTDIGSLKIREGNIQKNNMAIRDDQWPEKARRIMQNAGPKLPMPMSEFEF